MCNQAQTLIQGWHDSSWSAARKMMKRFIDIDAARSPIMNTY